MKETDKIVHDAVEWVKESPTPEARRYRIELVLDAFNGRLLLGNEEWDRGVSSTAIDVETGKNGFSVVTPGYHSRKPKKRSRRGIRVQTKRKQLGLNVWGKYDGVYSSLSRKDAYARAMETVKILVLCQECKEWFPLRVRRVETNNYWYRLQSAISCPNCGVQHEAGTQLWWRWKDK